MNYEAMQAEIDNLRCQNKKAKIFMFMVIHDLKHPTESLISSVEQTLKKFEDFKLENKNRKH
jgi:light-regulated signal transduction histidine kinase (bacteriophytochrome)